MVMELWPRESSQATPVCPERGVVVRGEPGGVAVGFDGREVGVGDRELRLQQETRGFGVGDGDRRRWNDGGGGTTGGGFCDGWRRGAAAASAATGGQRQRGQRHGDARAGSSHQSLGVISRSFSRSVTRPPSLARHGTLGI